MQIEKFLKNYQQVIYQTFFNSFKENRLSHAYLLIGNEGLPLLESATFFGKSLLCDDPSPLACNSCISCLRIDDDNYPDFVIFDGSKATIKKDDVIKIEEALEKEAFENKGIRIYILHLIENMTIEAINSILKLLEEPGKNIYAFLTTHNENAVLPTIISRCQLFHYRDIDKQIIIKDALDNGVEQKDAELLSLFYNDGEMIKEIIDNAEENDTFMTAKRCFDKTLTVLDEDSSEDIIYFAQSEVVSKIKNKQSCRYFINMLAFSFEDMIALKNDKQPFLESYATILNHLATKLFHLETSLVELLKCSTLLNTNVNIPLLLDHLFFTITKEE